MPSRPSLQAAAYHLLPWPSACSTYWMPSRALRSTHRRSFLRSNQRLAANILTREKEIESQRHGFLIGCAAVQCIEIRKRTLAAKAPPSVGGLVPACPRRRAETVSLLRGQVLAKSQPQRPQPCAWQTPLLHKGLRVRTKL